MASLTDNTLRNYESAPWLRDAIVTADKKISRATESGLLHQSSSSSSSQALSASHTFAGSCAPEFHVHKRGHSSAGQPGSSEYLRHQHLSLIAVRRQPAPGCGLRLWRAECVCHADG